MSSIFENLTYLDPKYAYLDKYVNIMFRGAWTPAKYEKLIKDQDIPYYFNQMDKPSKEMIRKCILAVATVEDKIKLFWPLIALDFPQTIIGDVAGTFFNSEVVHRRSYHSLVENLRMNLEEIKTYPALQGRLDYLNKHSEKDPRITGKRFILKKLVLFTALVERISLFTQFYILMSFSYRNKELNTIAALQQTTAKEEMIHYSFGLDLINQVKKESPEIWNEYLQELVEKNIQNAYFSELELIEWFFENGEPNHLSKEEVMNFLSYNFNEVCNDLDLSLSFPFDEDMFELQNKWFIEETTNTIEPDFFDNAVGGYSSEEVLTDIKDFKF